ncbi:MAG: HAMP domain-containing histidine kinase [Treponema sp.]|nr:HAMP domain-containing histidine kinase [Treponema sp.]
MKKIGRSFSVRLALRFMFILTIAVILLSFLFLFFIRSLVNANQTEELKDAEEKVFLALYFKQPSEYLLAAEIPYYVTYIIYDSDTKITLATNDPFLPYLPATNEKSVHYFEKDFFFDGDLDIVYYAKERMFDQRNITVATAINIDNNNMAEMFSNLPMALLFMSIPILLISFFVALFITKNTINPVVKITKTAKSMTTEKLDTLLPLTGRGDEIDELSGTFNDLFLRIKADFDRERQFSSDVSHELNTPLTVITGQANLLLRWGKDNPEQLEKSLLAIKDEAASMHAIIENLLQISRIESGRIKPETSSVDIIELFKRVEHEFSSVAPKVKFELSEEQKEPVIIDTDPEMLHQILTVLVSNSVKFAGDTCRIKLGVLKGHGHIIISESDDGPGISAEALPHVFERFYRGDEAHSRAAGGSGLGLSIAHTLADSLGATIEAKNVEPNGAEFLLQW